MKRALNEMNKICHRFSKKYNLNVGINIESIPPKGDDQAIGFVKEYYGTLGVFFDVTLDLNQIALSDCTLKETIIHELAHVLQFKRDGKWRGGKGFHGKKFKNALKELNKLFL